MAPRLRIGKLSTIVALGALITGLTPASASVCWGQSSGGGSTTTQDQSASPNSGSSKESGSEKKGNKADTQATTRLRIVVTSNSGKPISNASVYVRFPESGGLFHHDKLQELDLKTNQDGSVKVPPIPQGQVLVQVVAKSWRTFGKWYDVETDQQTIEIKLDPPPHWY